MDKFDFLIVGAGFSGSVLAERLASQESQRCLVVDKREHIAGNAYDSQDAAGVLLHRYGPHYFRTNSNRIVEYLSRFTEWLTANYQIMSWTDGQYWNFPINLNTFEQFVGHPSTSEEMQSTLEKWKVPIAQPKNSEEAVISQVGTELYEKFYKNYTRKQWNRSPRELDASVCARIEIRTNRDNRYFSDNFQALPREGYTKMFSKILDHPLIEVRLNTEYREIIKSVEYKHLIFTGPIDEYFDFKLGRLAYRSLRFELETIEKEYFQPVVQVNYPNENDFTRIVEVKHVTGQKLPVTTIVREYPQTFGPNNEPFYPVPAPETQALYRQYEEMAGALRNVTFVGRLATYRYYNMDQIVGMALTTFENLKKDVLKRV